MKNEKTLNKYAVRLREKLGFSITEPIKIIPALLSNLPELTLVFTPMADTSGLCINDGDIQIIGINSNLRKGRLRFTLAHELYHLLIEKTTGEPIICNNFIKNDSEIEADSFASYFLMPDEGLDYYETLNNISNWGLPTIIHAEQYFQVSHDAFLVRLEKRNKLSKHDKNLFSNVAITSEAKKLNHSIDLYLPTQWENENIVLGNYIERIKFLDSHNALKRGKKRKLLLDGFKWDLVFNTKK